MPFEPTTRTVRELRIFLASPGDVAAERAIVDKVIDGIDKTIASRKNATIRLLKWETDTYPMFHVDGPQGAIYEQLSIADCDIFLCVFWQRLGTPTRKANSGTEDEFWTAYDAWKKTGKPILMVYHSRAPVDLVKVDLEQVRRLQNLLANPKIKFENWISEYKDLDEFEENVRSHLSGIIQDILDGKIVYRSAETEESPDDPSEVELEKLDIPQEDWRILTHHRLQKYFIDLPEREAIAFFNGREPSWKESISPSIARREIVDRVKSELFRADTTTPHIVLLRGLGGEGKSTCLQQVIYEAVAQNPHIRILWHQHTNSPLKLDVIDELAQTDYEWIIASDDAENIEKDLRKAARHIREMDIENIRFLLATRDLDWKAVGGDAYGWLKSADFNTIHIKDLTETDAKNIVEKWGAYGSEGLGKLDGKSQKVAAHELLEMARTENRASGNSLLGAMLQVRTGRTLQEHLKPILSRLDGINPGGNISLKKVIAYISALHAYNIKILTPAILADALGCREDELRELVLNHLGAEIISEKYILIRHASIAESIKDILKDEYDFEQLSRKLLRSANNLYTRRIIQPEELSDWNKLPKLLFFEKGDKELGIALAKEAMESRLVDNSKYDPVAVTNLADLYEKSQQGSETVRLFREKYPKTKTDRAYYFNWAVAEGKNKHCYLAVWLSGVSFADGIFEKRRDTKRIFVSLSGLSSSFKHAYEQTGNHLFAEACYASADLGLSSNPDEKAYKNLMDSFEYAESVNATISHDLIPTIINGIKSAWAQRNEDLHNSEIFGKFPEGVPTPDKLKFTWIENIFKNRK